MRKASGLGCLLPCWGCSAEDSKIEGFGDGSKPDSVVEDQGSSRTPFLTETTWTTFNSGRSSGSALSRSLICAAPSRLAPGAGPVSPFPGPVSALHGAGFDTVYRDMTVILGSGPCRFCCPLELLRRLLTDLWSPPWTSRSTGFPPATFCEWVSGLSSLNTPLAC